MRIRSAHHIGRRAISSDKTASWVYCEDFVAEGEALMRARARAAALGCPSVLPGAGAVLRFVAGTIGAKSVVEIGSSAGVSALWLLAGMPDGGVLTTIDADPAFQHASKESFAEADIRPNRTRVISGRPSQVLPRLADGAYDLVLVGGRKTEYGAHAEQAIRLLRPGGVVAVHGALWHDHVADPARRDEVTTAVREVGRQIRDDDRLIPALLPSGDGLLLATKL